MDTRIDLAEQIAALRSEIEAGHLGHASRLHRGLARHLDADETSDTDRESLVTLTRELNLEFREALCDEITRYAADLPDDDIDFKSLQAFIVRSKRDWRRYGDIPRGQRHKSDARFSHLIAPLESLVIHERDRNHTAKKAIIHRLRALLSDEAIDINRLIEETKQLQVDWKSIGITHHRKDQRLWKTFRKLCDAVFERRKALREE